jgi:hypothetical protein
MTILSSLCALFTPFPGETSVIPIMIGLLILAMGIIYMVIAWGLWELRNWARITVIVFQALNLVSLLIVGALFIFGIDLSSLDPYMESMGGTLSFPGIGIGFWVLAAIPGVIIWYLFTPNVQSAFGVGDLDYYAPPPAPAVAPPAYAAPLPPTEAVPPPVAQPEPALPAAPPLDPTRLVGQPTAVNGWLVIRSGVRAGTQQGLRTSSPTDIGRDASRCDLVLDDPAVSREHARVQWEHGQFILYDLASVNGTWVNNQRVQRQSLMDGDAIRIGDTTMVFKSVE